MKLNIARRATGLLVPQASLRSRTGLIFFAGLLLFLAAVIAVSLTVDGQMRRDAAAIALLEDADRQVTAWVAAAVAADLPATAPDPSQVALVLNGGAVSLAGSPALQLGPMDDEELIRPLTRALSAWPAFSLAIATGQAEPTNLTARQRIREAGLPLQAALAEASSAMRLRQAASSGMVRGMYAALFLASLVFLLIGLWFTQQIVVAPVEALNQVARRITAGDLDTPVGLGGSGEFLDLARTFEAMRLELRRSRERLTLWTSELESHVARRTQELIALSQVIAAASRSLEFGAVLRAGLEQSLQAVNLEMGGIWLVDEGAGDLQLAASQQMPEAFQAQVRRLGAGQGATGRAAQSGQTIVLEDIAQAPSTVMNAALEQGLRGMVAAPIKLRDHVLGVLTVMTRQPRAFRPEEITLLTSIGQQIGIAVDSLRLAEEVRQQAERVAALQERERIGIELHDGLLQTLGYLYLKADQLEAAAAQHGFTDMAIELASYRTVLERASGDARRFIADLRETPPAPPKPLQLTLAEMVAAFQSESPMQVSVVGGDQPILLDPDRSAHVVRIAREALVNAAQHGQARRASVTCSWRDGLGELVIADDGLGFEADQAPGDGREHFGLTIMRARAARIGGQLRVDSAPGRGTRVHVTWPQAGS